MIDAIFRALLFCLLRENKNSISETHLNPVLFLIFFIAEALRLHGSRLTDYERQEIDKYPEIWFLGLDACKINAKPGTALNSGYDDDNGSYNKVSINSRLYFYFFSFLKSFKKTHPSNIIAMSIIVITTNFNLFLCNFSSQFNFRLFTIKYHIGMRSLK